METTGIPTTEPPTLSSRSTIMPMPLLFALAGVLWLWAGRSNVSLTPGAVVPWSSGSLLGVEWAAIGALFLVAALASWHRSALGAAVGVPLVTLTVIDILLTLGPFTGHLTFPVGVALASIAIVCAAAATFWGLVRSRSSRSLTRPGLVAALLTSLPAVAWAIAYAPSWRVTNYSVVGGTFSATGTDRLSIPNGNLFDGGAYFLVMSIFLLTAPLVLAGWSSLWRNTADRLWANLTCGVILIAVVADSLWDLGPITRAQLPHWWGWADHGQISTVATPWLWIGLAAGVALSLIAIVTAAWAKTESLPA